MYIHIELVMCNCLLHVHWSVTIYAPTSIGSALCVVVTFCSDTVGRSGMFCAITTTIERCKTEGVVDVFQVIKALRVQKPGAVQTLVNLISISLL